MWHFYLESNLVSGDTNGYNDIFVTANPFAWAPEATWLRSQGAKVFPELTSAIPRRPSSTSSTTRRRI